MEEQTVALEGPTREQQVRAKKMLLTVGIFSIVMMFAAFSSAYIVSKFAARYWVNITIPQEFTTSTLLIIASSITLFAARKFLFTKKQSLSGILTIVTLILGTLFCMNQYQGFLKLSELGLNFTGNYIEHLNGEYGKDYVITTNTGEVLDFREGDYYLSGIDEPVTHEIEGLGNTAASYFNGLVIVHVVHVGAGILFLVALVIMVVINFVNRENNLWFRQIERYWHFVDGLWIYLFLFLYFIH